MDIQKRALYNSLRMNWLIDPSLEVEAWQVENYREMSLPLILSHLETFDIEFTIESFSALAEDFDTPEELTEFVLQDETLDPETEDRIYLLLFELWRRIETDKPCLSVFCDELDHQMFLYDHGKTQNAEDIEDALSNLDVILDENTDQGVDPNTVLQLINNGCANDIETFLYDFINSQIENANYSYALELLANFIDYVSDDKWFDLLQVRILSYTDTEEAEILIQQLAEEAIEDDDLQFNLEILSEMCQEGLPKTFSSLVRSSSKLLNTEEDFQDLLSLCIDYYCLQDEESKESSLQNLLESRPKKNLANRFDTRDPDLEKFLSIIG
ncbi:MAG: hypothetical protein VX777_08990 [Chlamydiota bacterium]|nr:hypothetical protein [Chlamydiota bacterium]